MDRATRGTKMQADEITEHFFEGSKHTSFYRASGPDDGTPIIFVHGWPELSLSWRHQLRALGALGFRCIAPDLRGYGRSSIYPDHGDYALENVVGDMLELADGNKLVQSTAILNYIGNMHNLKPKDHALVCRGESIQ